MAGLPWYPWCPSDFRQKTGTLSLFERGVYREMLDAAWDQRYPGCKQGHLPSNRAAIADLLTGRSDDSNAVREAVDKVADLFWDERGETLSNRRLSSEARKAVKKQQDASNASAKRWHSGRNADALPTQSGRSTDAILLHPDPDPDLQAHPEPHPQPDPEDQTKAAQGAHEPATKAPPKTKRAKPRTRWPADWKFGDREWSTAEHYGAPSREAAGRLFQLFEVKSVELLQANWRGAWTTYCINARDRFGWPKADAGAGPLTTGERRAAIATSESKRLLGEAKALLDGGKP